MGLLNGFKLTILFSLLIAILATIGFLLLGVFGLVIGLLFGGLMNIASFYYSDKFVTKIYGAEPVDESERPELHELVEKLANKAEIPKPKVYMMESQNPNAFATGRNPDNSLVCVTTSLLKNLSSEEVEGVLAHEISHIKNRDTLIQTVAGTIAGAISVISNMLWLSSLGGRERKNPILMIVGIVLAPIAAMMIKMAISRSREYSADSSATDLTDPKYLADALKKIDEMASKAPIERGTEGTSHIFIINPFRGNLMARLFSTHPPVEDRINRLLN